MATHTNQKPPMPPALHLFAGAYLEKYGVTFLAAVIATVAMVVIL